ncbi:MAG: rhodanese-like domain-containing protein [Actinomycetota bacterium]|nr:rhodanese-like domain-containing protein [Actinomycetota bacterium]
MSELQALLDAARGRIDRYSPEEAVRAVEDGAVLVDIRPADQRAATGEIPGALVIARNVLEWRLEPGGADRHPDAPEPEAVVIVVCQAGYASSLAAASLRDLGIDRAGDLDGGVEAWRAVGLPLAH